MRSSSSPGRTPRARASRHQPRGVPGAKGETVTRALPRFVRRVTRAHGTRFAATWVNAQPDFNGDSISNAFQAARVMTWPEDRNARRDTPAQEKYLEIERAILKRTAELLRGAIGEAFMQAANEIFDRERDA